MVSEVIRSLSHKIPAPGIARINHSHPFLGSIAKLHRARLHAHEVSVVWEQAVQAHNASVQGVNQNPEAAGHSPIYVSIPIVLPLALGDCVRNLRSALDYLVSAMARRIGLSDEQTVFPFAKTRSGLEASFNEPVPGDKHRKGRRAGALYELSRKYPELQKTILVDIGPYSADDGADPFGDLLWRIVTSDNIDKHRLMTPTVHRATDVNIATNNGIFMSGIEVIGDCVQFPPGTQLEKNSHFSVDILFEEPARLAGKPVTSTLVQGCNAVGQVIEIFSDKFAS